MSDKTQKPLINVTEKGRNFRMTDCEFEMGASKRPILETNAENTQIKRTKVTTQADLKIPWWKNILWQILVPLLVAIVGGAVLFFLGMV